MKTRAFLPGTACLFLSALGACCLAAPAPTREGPITLNGHSGFVHWVAFSPDGKTLASVSWDKTVKLWDVATGKNTATLEGHSDSVRAVVFSPNGKTLASGGRDETVRLWDVTSGKETATFKMGNFPVSCLAFSPDGKTLASACQGGPIKLWDLETNKERATLQVTGDELGPIVPKPDAKDKKRGPFDGDIGSQPSLMSMAYSRDGKPLAVGITLRPLTLVLWDLTTGKKTATLEGHKHGVDCVAFSPDGKTLASGDHDTLQLWDVTTGKNLGTFPQPGRVVCVTFSPDGETLALGHKPADGSNKEGTIRLLNTTTGKEVTTLKGHTGSLFCVAFSPDGKILASASMDKTIKLWEVPAAKKADK